MFLGHFALGFAAKRAAPEVSLGAAFLAAQLPDLLWPVLLLAGVERVEPTRGETPFLNLDFVSYPYSHSLLGMAVAGLALAALWYALVRARTVRGAVLVFALVVSHWVLDWVTHRPDLPIGLDGQHYGLGLWSNAPLTIGVELAAFAIGLWLYVRGTRAVSRAGTWGLWSLVVVLLGIYAGAAFGPPPPGWEAVAWAGLLSWLFPLWGWRVDVGRRRA